MEGTTLEFLPLLDSISFSTDYRAYKQKVPCKLDQFIEAKTFRIQTPDHWELIEDLSHNSYVGRIENSAVSLFFEQGPQSFSRIKEIRQNDNTIYFERLIINGADAVIHKVYCEESRSNILTIYLENSELKNKIFVFNASDEEGIIMMFKTHQFRN